ncbi:MAG: FUSC family protein [Actinobacteria bacterium]|nr:FUSC family protein [Actinomycetota bacterium]
MPVRRVPASVRVDATSGEAPAPPRLSWSWADAALGAAYALPAALVALGDPGRGIALAVGVLPAAVAGLPPRRRGRLLILALGLLTGLPMLVGGLLAGLPVAAVAAVAGLALGAVWLARHARAGRIAMVLSLPMVGIGLSYPDVGQAARLAGLMVAGSALACAVSMLWPEREPPVARRPPEPPPTLDYGLRLAAAGASAAAIGFAFDLEHVGWATAAALLVMRPTAEMQRLRSVGRICAVALGAVVAIALVRLQPAAAWLALAALATIAGAAATHRSRWYVTPAFTTFLVFLLLLHADPADSRWRLGERLIETCVGVGLAYLFGLAVPALRDRLSATARGR